MDKPKEKKETLKVQIPASMGKRIRKTVRYGKKTKFVVEALQEKLDRIAEVKPTEKPESKPAELTKVEEEIYQHLLPDIEETMKGVYGKHYLHMPIDEVIVTIYFYDLGNRGIMLSKEVEEYWRNNRKALAFEETPRNELLKKLSNRWISDNKAEEPEELNTRINDLMTVRDLLAKL